MHFQLSTILSIFVLALSNTAQASPPPPGVTVTYDDRTVKFFKYGECIEATNPAGSTINSGLFSDPTNCNLFHVFGCSDSSVPVAFPPAVPIPNVLGAQSSVVKSVRCQSSLA
ncbi:hypothetical protein M422DRAFT_272410 [Sphaerobolus stellatus SS14]|uniref:SSCRP protein n=1 Tax=Sphaerobolus stellatus (strain SS14) TaxID=990650 RepID=A0A0C9TXK0_SPHS4|nr:hypothetical protein M422DRAFT_272410 [Sphaerobolus stellatus SS14]